MIQCPVFIPLVLSHFTLATLFSGTKKKNPKPLNIHLDTTEDNNVTPNHVAANKQQALQGTLRPSMLAQIPRVESQTNFTRSHPLHSHQPILHLVGDRVTPRHL